MHFGRAGMWIFALGLGLSGFAASAQQAAPAVSLSAELVSLASRSAAIFVGQVAGIERREGVVEVSFAVEQPIIGVSGARYVLREWSGLWPQGQYRYVPGQRVLVFLNGSSAAGFGSPVDGAEGVVPVVVQGANAPELLDVRRLSAALLRPVGTALPGEASGAILLADALPLIAAGLAGGANRLPRPEPVRVPMPVHGGLTRGGVAGATGAANTSTGYTEPVTSTVTGTSVARAGASHELR